MSPLKGPGEPQQYDGSSLRIGIVHARWNTPIITALVAGARKSLSAAGVREENIVVQDVPGSYELPFAVQSLITSPPNSPPTSKKFDSIIAIGVLIKGETMHFEYISDAVSHGLMRVQLDCRIPLVFGLLTALSEEQALQRAGIGSEEGHRGHCHGEDWGAAAVELGVKTSAWMEGKLV